MEFEDFLRFYNISLKIVNLPCKIRGFATYNGNEYLVLINARCDSVQQRQTTIHELVHILDNHFSMPQGYEEKCEKEVNYFIKELKLNYII